MKECNYTSVTIDGATENEATYVKYVHDGLPGNHTQLSYAHAGGVTEFIQSSMATFGLFDWKQKPVGSLC